MYSLDINFLKHRPEYRLKTEAKFNKLSSQIGNFTPIYVGLAVGLVFPVLVFVGFLFLQEKIPKVRQDIGKLEDQSKSLDGTIAKIRQIKAETTNINNQTKAFASVFYKIHSLSAILQDLSDRIPPNVQIETIKQTTANTSPNSPAGLLEISGFAVSYAAVNDFLLSLGQSKFLNPQEIKVITTEFVDAPAITGFVAPADAKSNVKIKKIQVVKYTIKTGLSSLPASDLIQELEKKGAVGLVNRLRYIQKEGVIAK
jgi:type IV pilus assembly protein PilN